jgi:two-component system, chemotaxis family, CheB/CheR fusion protein
MSNELTNSQASSENNALMTVGVGASASGIEALKHFFALMPPDSDMAFVVILHPAGQFEGNLHEILQKETKMPVVRVTETIKIVPNRVYVIPPAKHPVVMADGSLHLTEPKEIAGERAPIDLFFRSLADSYQKNGVAIILSGIGNDGMLGIKRIKEMGGIVLAQDPSEADLDAMPRSAVAANFIDLILPVAEMPEKLITIKRTAEKMLFAVSEEETEKPLQPTDAKTLTEILSLLLIRTGHDFLSYKPTTVLRRVARRMQLYGMTQINDYLVFVREQPNELQVLLRDLLVSVTNFFRDREAFDALERKVIPKLFAGKKATDEVRVWAAATATGEEAYSMAMLLCEYAEKLPDAPKLQVFATDIDARAISIARDCVYDETITTDVSSERLQKFFTKQGNHYRLKKTIRDMVLFASHNILRDPPFSRMDMISCRNLLNSLRRDAQEKVLRILNFALRDDGFLFLGSTETAEQRENMFSAIDKTHRIYRSLSRPNQIQTMPTLPPVNVKLQTERPENAHSLKDNRFLFSDVHFKLVEQFAPPSVLVGEDYEILHLSENANRYLRFTGGEPSRQLLKAVYPSLKSDLRAALFTARQERRPIEIRSFPTELDGEVSSVNVTVRFIESQQNGQGYFLIIFEESTARVADDKRKDAGSSNAISDQDATDVVIRNIEEELERTKQNLRSTIEQHETSTEELKATNEELLTINEELRSTTEELEASKEELQSVNEELLTVNHELKDKLEELNRADSDLQNLMASTDIGTIFLDRGLKLKRYNPPILQYFNLIPSDLGRPLEHITNRLNYDQLIEDATGVLTSLQTIVREIRSADDKWYLARIVPYRTENDVIEGIVMTFLDITERKLGEETRRWLASVVQSSNDAIVSYASDGRIASWNPGAQRIFGYAPEEAVGQPTSMLAPPEKEREQAELFERVRRGEFIDQHDTVRVRKNGEPFYVTVTASPIKDHAGTFIGVTSVIQDITARKLTEEKMRESEKRLKLILESIEDYAILTITPDKRVNSWNPGAEKIFGYRDDEIIGRSSEVLFTPEDRATHQPEAEMETALREGRATDERWHIRKDNSRFYASGVMTLLGENENEPVGFVKVCRDLTERKQMEEALREGDRRKDEFLATLAHELRNPLAPIRTALEIMRSQADKEKGIHAREIVERQTDQLVHLVDDLLDISRITQGKISLKKESVDLAGVIQTAVETVQPFVENMRHKLDIRLPDAPVFIEADPIRLTQIVFNLLHNSAKYTEPGGHILLIAAREDEGAAIRVRDNGIGIPDDMLPKIFDMFAQTSRGVKQGQGGLGIGLSLVKKLVEMHGGAVEAQSYGEGKGSEFIVRLPLAVAASAGDAADDATRRKEIAAKSGEQNFPSTAGRQLRVLVVDDNEDAAEMLQIALTMQNYTVRTASDGAGAISAAIEFQPNFAILDIGLPDITGYELAEKLRETAAQTKLIALSGWGQDDDRQRSFKSGFRHHLVKPVKIEDLLKLLNEE